MAVTQELRTMFTADTSPLSSALGKLRKSAFMPVMVGAGLAAGATMAWYAASERTAKTLDDQAKAARRVGLSGAEIQRYGMAARLSGADLGALESATKRMHRVILDSERGMKTANDTLKALGLTQQDLAGKSPDEQLRMVMEALAGVADSSRQAALAQEIFGRSGTQLKPMLDKGVEGFRALMAEREKIGPLFSDEQLASGEEMQDQILRNKEAFKLMIDQLVLEGFPLLMDGLTQLLTILSTIGDNLDHIKTAVGVVSWANPGKWVGEGMLAAADKIERVATGVNRSANMGDVEFRRRARAQFAAAGQLRAFDSQASNEEITAALQQLVANTNALPQLAN